MDGVGLAVGLGVGVGVVGVDVARPGEVQETRKVRAKRTMVSFECTKSSPKSDAGILPEKPITSETGKSWRHFGAIPDEPTTKIFAPLCLDSRDLKYQDARSGVLIKEEEMHMKR
jgi:hypothetical protein